MSYGQPKIYPAYCLVAQFADGSRLRFSGITYEQAYTAMNEAQAEHGDIAWYDGVTDEHYENGKFYAAIPPPPQLPFPLIDPVGEQETLFEQTENTPDDP